MLLIEPAFHGESTLKQASGETTIDVYTEHIDQIEEEFNYFTDCLLSGYESHVTS